MQSLPPRGRPKDPALRSRILAVAREEFIQHGLEGSSLETIARAAGTSRVTIYAHFAGKDALFQAAMNQVVVDAVQIADDELDKLPMEQQLQRLATAFLDSVSTPQAAAHIHALYQSSKKVPGASEAFYASGPQRILDLVKRTLVRLVDAGELAVPDIDCAAEQFVALVRGNEQMRALLSMPPARKGRERAAYLDSSVRLFIAGHAPS